MAGHEESLDLLPGDGAELCRLMRGDAQVALVGSLDEARVSRTGSRTRTKGHHGALVQLRQGTPVPTDLPSDVHLIDEQTN